MQFDIVVIGAGPGGYVAAIRAAQLGKKVAIVEREALGGICLNWGCIPTKALLKSAQVLETLSHAQDYGIRVKSYDADFGAIISRSRSVADGMSKGIQFLMKKNKIQVYSGSASLAADKSVVVVGPDGKSEQLLAKHVILATGGRAKQLDNLPIDGKYVIDYRKAMVLDKVPKKMAIVGAGAIGVEFAYFYNSLGTEVHLIEFLEQGLVPREDPDISRELTKIFRKKGIQVYANTALEKVDRIKGGMSITAKNRTDGKTVQLDCDVVLSAAGVQPNTENLGLESLKVKTDRSYVVVDRDYRTNVEGVYAIGDIVPGPALAHVASAEAIHCVERICGLPGGVIDYKNIPACTYCTPEIASVGLTEPAAKEAGYDLAVGKFPFSASGKASAAGAKDGFVKVIFEKKYGEFLGAHLIGMNVTEMIAEVVVARKLETTGHEIIKSIHPHPTMSEAIMEAAAAAFGEVIHL
ncbi:MAG: dihydrolipoyl dehydrogenase [Saprospiraceae bacterium]|jgi:dihydrolipoamide dehydrogenase|nr:dihydrolipoyl dehydrogenase [Saprospiraceae bacterium]MBP9209655.1 dihydrolipoyl dehydrogenase [Saprospiraceae bacterium]MBV6471984.1 Dihydrolipoyl dehydrogenase [Saprospiraceae bacterium]